VSICVCVSECVFCVCVCVCVCEYVCMCVFMCARAQSRLLRVTPGLTHITNYMNKKNLLVFCLVGVFESWWIYDSIMGWKAVLQKWLLCVCLFVHFSISFFLSFFHISYHAKAWPSVFQHWYHFILRLHFWCLNAVDISRTDWDYKDFWNWKM